MNHNPSEHEMRRKDKEITDSAALLDILQRGPVCRLAFVDSGEPYIVPMNFAYREDCLYFHSAAEGRKVDLIRQNPRVCFEVTVDEELVTSGSASKWTMRYRSVIGWGTAEVVADVAEKQEALQLLMEHYSGRTDWEFPAESVKRVMIFRVRIDRMTGKKSRLP